MGLFDFFRKKEQPPVAVTVADNKLLEPVEVMPGIKLPSALATHWTEIEKTKLPFVSITATPSSQLNIEQSSFGYYPRLPKGYEYPRDVEGNLMYPLAQINCSELPVLANYPKFGYLQFYISNNDVFGADFDNPQLQAHFKVLYFEDDEVADHQTDFTFLDEVIQSDNVPVFKPHRLDFSVKEEYFGIGDVRWEEGSFDLPKIAALHPNIENELQEYVWDNFQPNGHKMGGYAYFTQSDPRDSELKDYILLLQIDSADEIMWGDLGVANFFIHPEDLVKKDFSKVMYNWDCS